MTATIDQQDSILEDIRNERQRQERLKASGKFVYSCADGGISDTERFTVLTEEVGEVAHELNERVGRGSRREEYFASKARLRAELIQVAAVAVAWVEALDTNPPVMQAALCGKRFSPQGPCNRYLDHEGACDRREA